jgi:hypothetical protein
MAPAIDNSTFAVGPPYAGSRFQAATSESGREVFPLVADCLSLAMLNSFLPKSSVSFGPYRKTNPQSAEDHKSGPV